MSGREGTENPDKFFEEDYPMTTTFSGVSPPLQLSIHPKEERLALASPLEQVFGLPGSTRRDEKMCVKS